MDEDIKKPDHLCRFPCMYPWIGPKYECSERRLAIVAESHYLPSRPQNATTRLNYHPEKWYAAKQEDFSAKAQSWMNTDWCVRNRHMSHNCTYQKIENVLNPHGLSFDDIVFFNYVFRPAEHCKPGYSQVSDFDILYEDRKVSSDIMEWFICEHRPTAIIIASTTVIQYTCVKFDLADSKKDACMTDHPSYWRQNTNPFSKDVRDFLDKLDKGRAQPDQAILCGGRANENLRFALTKAEKDRFRPHLAK